MDIHEIIAEGYEHCSPNDPDRQYVDGQYYKPKMGSDSLDAVVKAAKAKYDELYENNEALEAENDELATEKKELIGKLNAPAEGAAK